MKDSEQIEQTCSKLQQAHLAHELQRFKTSFNADAKQFYRQLYAAIEAVPLQQLLGKSTATDFALTSITNLNSNEKYNKAQLKMVAQFYQHQLHQQQTVADLINKQQYKSYVKHSLSLKKLRHHLTVVTLTSSTYEEFVADLVLSAISAYVEESANLTTERVFGAKTVLKVSKGLLQKAAPKLENKVEEQIRKFIHLLMPELTAKSIQLINAISDEKLEKVAMNVFQSIKNQPTATLRNYLSSRQIEKYAALNLKTFQKLKLSKYLHNMLELSIDAFYAQYGSHSLANLLEDLGLDIEVLIELYSSSLEQLMPTLLENGFIETILQQRLADFYHSQQAQKIISELINNG